MTAAVPIETAEALADLQAVAELGSKHPDLLEALGRLIDEGTPILQIDRTAAASAGEGVVRYKLAEELRVILAAVRARNVDANVVKSSSCHSAPLSGEVGAERLTADSKS